MKYTFSVIIEKNQSDSLGQAIVIPKLNMRLHISPGHLQEIKDSGYSPLLEKLILAILQKKEEEGNNIATPRLLDTVLDSYLDKKHAIIPKLHDILLEVNVDFKPKRQCRCCATVLPPLTKITILAEIAAGTIITIGTLQLTEGFISMRVETAQALAITQSILSAMFGLWISFSGPGMAFIQDFGSTVDDKLMQAWQKLTCQKTKNSIASTPPQSCNVINTKIKIFQSAFLLLAINNLWADITKDYQELSLLRDKMTSMDDLLIPSWLITGAAWTEFCFNQLNDPIELLSLIVLGFTLIHAYFSVQRHSNDADFSKTETGEWLSEKEDEEISIVIHRDSSFSEGLKRFGLHSSTSVSSSVVKDDEHDDDLKSVLIPMRTIK